MRRDHGGVFGEEAEEENGGPIMTRHSTIAPTGMSWNTLMADIVPDLLSIYALREVLPLASLAA